MHATTCVTIRTSIRTIIQATRHATMHTMCKILAVELNGKQRCLSNVQSLIDRLRNVSSVSDNGSRSGSGSGRSRNQSCCKGLTL